MLYNEGSIISIRLHCFLAHSDLFLKLGPKLNVIIAPNGSGKTAILEALVLALGGSRYTGDKDWSNYIMRGQDSAYVEVRIKWAAQHDPIIRLDLKRHEGQRQPWRASWMVDGKASPNHRKRMEEKLGIRLDNLCVFLPYHKLEEIAKMDNHHLLIITEQAVGIVAERDEIKKREEFMVIKAREEEDLRATVEQLEQDYQHIGADYERAMQRDQHLDKAQRLMKAKIWKRYDKQKAICSELKTSYNEVKKERDSKAKEVEPLQATMGVIQKRHRDAIAEVVKRKGDEEKVNRAYKSAKEAYKGHKCHLVTATENQMTWKEKRSAKKKEKDRYQSQLASALAEAPGEEEVAQAEADIRSKLGELQGARQKKASQHTAREEDVRKKRTDLGSVQQQIKDREELVKGSTERHAKQKKNFENQGSNSQSCKHVADSLAARKWLKERHGNRPITGPLALEITLLDQEAAAIVESCVGFRTMSAMVVENRDDEKFLHEEQAQHRWTFDILRVNKRLRKGLEKELKRRRQMEDSLWQMGLRYVDTVVACSSELVKLALFAHTPVFEHLFKKGGDPMNLPNLMSRTGGRSVTVYTHRTYNGKVEAFKKSIFLGRYDQPIESSKSVRGASILCANIEPQILQRAKQKLVELRASEDRINSDISGFDAEMATIQGEITDIDRKMQQLRNTPNQAMTSAARITQLRQDLAKVEGSLPELEANINACKDKVRTRVGGLVPYAITTSEAKVAVMPEGMAMAPFKVEEVTTNTEKSRSIVKTSEKLASKTKELKGLDQDCEAKKDEWKRATARAEERLKQCKEEAPYLEEHGANYDAELARMLDGEYKEKGVDEVKEAIKEERDKASEFKGIDPNIGEKYKALKARLEAEKKGLEESAKAHQDYQEKTKQLKEKWVMDRQDLVTRLDGRFSTYMRQMGVNGGVALVAPEGASIDDYGLEIRTAFHKGSGGSGSSMKALTTMNSGGECSASTILFLMALQREVASPVRMVDEFNKGLDAEREGLVFSRIVANTAHPDAPQFIMIAPTFLPATTIVEHPQHHVNVHSIQTGVTVGSNMSGISGFSVGGDNDEDVEMEVV